MLINEHQSINGVYADLCIKLRELQNSDDCGTAICQWCGRPKSNHLNDNRCDVSTLSQYFRPRWAEHKKKIERALSLIEELKAI